MQRRKEEKKGKEETNLSKLIHFQAVFFYCIISKILCKSEYKGKKCFIIFFPGEEK